MQVRAGGIAACLRSVLAMEDAPLRFEILRQMLKGFAETSWLEDLLTGGLDDGVPVRSQRVAAAPSEDLADALGVAQAIADDQGRAVSLGVVAAAYALSGAFSDALRAASSIMDPEARYFAFRIVAGLAAAGGRSTEAKVAYDEAYAIARKLDGKPKEPNLRDSRLSPLAIGMAQAGFVKEALDVVGTMEGNLSNASFGVDGRIANADYERRYALYAIAEAQGKIGAVTEAIATARSINREGEILGLEVGVAASGLAARCFARRWANARHAPRAAQADQGYAQRGDGNSGGD